MYIYVHTYTYIYMCIYTHAYNIHVCIYMYIYIRTTCRLPKFIDIYMTFVLTKLLGLFYKRTPHNQDFFSRISLATGWRRISGCLKLPVIFRKRATNYRALLRKMTYKD